MNEKNVRLLSLAAVVSSALLVSGFFILKQETDFAFPSVFNRETEKIIIEKNDQTIQPEEISLSVNEEKIQEDINELNVETEEEQENKEIVPVLVEESGKATIAEEKMIMFNQPARHKGDNLLIGFITDIHAQSDYAGGKWKLKTIFPDRINYFLRQMNDNLGPDIIIVNGDIIEGTKIPAVQGREEIRQIREIFDKTSIKKYWIIGNHDLRSIEKAQWEKALGIDYTYKSFKIKGYKIIILDSNFNEDGKSVSPGNSYTRGNMSEKEMSWLEKELSSSEKKIIFMHHPPLRGIASTPDINLIKNANELRTLFSENNVVAVFAGHIEDLYSEEYNGVKYFVFPGIYKNSKYQGTFVSIDINKSKVKAEMNYMNKDGSYKKINVGK